MCILLIIKYFSVPPIYSTVQYSTSQSEEIYRYSSTDTVFTDANIPSSKNVL